MTLFPITGESLPSGGFKSAYNGVIRGPALPSHSYHKAHRDTALQAFWKAPSSVIRNSWDPPNTSHTQSSRSIIFIFVISQFSCGLCSYFWLISFFFLKNVVGDRVEV